MTRITSLWLFTGLLFAAHSSAQSVTHRWSFNSTGPVTNGTVIPDAISAAPGVIVGTGATRNGTTLTLPGTTSGNFAASVISGYFDLPNGIVSSKTNMTVEIWATVVSSKSWQRLFDFGRMDITGSGGGEINTTSGAPGNSSSSDNFILAAQRGDIINDHRLAARLDGATELGSNNTTATSLGTQYHYVAIFQAGVGANPTTGGRFTYYRNGTLISSFDTNFRLNQIEDVNNWLGRSQYSGDSNSNITYNEVRLYDYALSQAQITASGSAGVDKVFPAPTTVADSLTMNRGQKAKLNVLANDSGEIAVASLAIEQAPLVGTAIVTADRQILYTHTTGTPTSDSFTYRIANTTGQTTTAVVTLNFATTLRLANPNLNVPALPPATAFALVDALPGLTFSSPLCLRTPPGETQRLFICEKDGLLKVVPDVTVATPTATTFLNLPALLTSRGETIDTGSECGLLSIAFHPNYAANRYFYIFYSVTAGGIRKERVSRFTTLAGSPNSADLASERILINQTDDANNHNGGDMHFGPDGYLYISVGDEGDANDTLNNSQTITKDIFSAILRIDVDLEGNEIAGGNPGDPDDANRIPQAHAAIPLYSSLPAFEIPVNNPYVHTTRGGTWNGSFNGTTIATLAAVRDEFWAVGLRNPWRFSFDGSDLWCGDVGQNLLEEVDLIQKGKNYGWAYREANINGAKSASAPANFDTLYHTPPLYLYDRNTANFNGNSITGGIVYRGSRLGSLTGKYIFADYGSGNVWSLLRNGANPPTVERLTAEGGIAAFGADPSNQDILLADINNNRILRLTTTTVTGGFPTTLTATRLFADLADLSPAPGLLPYSVNLPFWSDHAAKKRWFIIPNGTSTFGWAPETPWSLPTGTIYVKHFDMVMNRNPLVATAPILKRIETRLIVKNTAGAYGVSYRWNAAGTEATLAEDGGENFVLNVTDGGNPAPQTWRIPSRSECMTCHTPQAGYALSFNTRQLNREPGILGFPGNQLDVLRQNSFFTGTLPGSPNLLPRHLRPDETAFSMEARVRSYLAVNCAYCHKLGGTAPSAWDGRAEITLDATGLILGNASNNGGDPLNKLVVPGSTSHSIVLQRIAATNGFTRMPPLASNVIDQSNVTLIGNWITGELAARKTYAVWRLEKFGSSSSSEGLPTADPDADGADNQAEFLAATLPLNGASTLRLQLTGNPLKLGFTLPVNRSFLIESSTNLGQWTPWDVPGNQGLPVVGDPITLPITLADPQRFFRVKLSEN